VTETIDQIQDFKKLIDYKNVFLVGLTQQTLESETLMRFLHSLIDQQMRPLSLFLLKNVPDNDSVVQ